MRYALLIALLFAACGSGEERASISAGDNSTIIAGDQNSFEQTITEIGEEKESGICTDICLERGNNPVGIESSDCVAECRACADQCGAFRGDCYDECTGNAEPEPSDDEE